MCNQHTRNHLRYKQRIHVGRLTTKRVVLSDESIGDIQVTLINWIIRSRITRFLNGGGVQVLSHPLRDTCSVVGFTLPYEKLSM